ncbi:MAG: efflux RND transporter periplasmic adaptor subunit [Xanthomonadales bacterium]|nr:efflux RND transporter periplasmic adaptor subunit [Xanthomonadales bacterium]
MDGLPPPAPAPRPGIRDTAAQDRVLAVDPRLRRRRLLRHGAVAAALLAGLAWLLPDLVSTLSATRSVSADRLRIATVERGTLVRDLAVQGRIVAAVSPTLYAPAAGTVGFLVAPGDEVELGAPLAELRSPELDNALSRERSTLQGLEIEVARARIDNRKRQLLTARTRDEAEVALLAAQREMQRADAAWATRSISEVDHLRARDALRNAELGFGHAGADSDLERESLAFELRARELALDRQRLVVADLARQVEELTIRAPVAGRVGTLLVADRSAVGRDAGLLTVIDLSRLELEIDAPESFADDLSPGLPGEVAFQGRAFRAELASLSPEVVNGQVRARLRFVEEQPSGLRQSQRLSARVLIDERNDVLKVQRGPFVEAGSGRQAYVVVDGFAVRRPIQLGAGSLSEIEVVSGLSAGDRIVIAGTDAFEDAERIHLTGDRP